MRHIVKCGLPRSTTFFQFISLTAFGPKRDEKTGECFKLHNGELHDVYSSSNIVRVIKSRIRWAGHAALMGRREACIGFWWGNLRERDHWGDPSVNGRIILGRIFRKRDVWGMYWIGLAQDRKRWRAIMNAVMSLRVR
jgi:hypothetical protein